MKRKHLWTILLTLFVCMLLPACGVNAAGKPSRYEVSHCLYLANQYWQKSHSSHGNYFWNRAVYHVGNMEAFAVTGNRTFSDFSCEWAGHNGWSGARGEWSNSYGETNVLFGDCQICFQVYYDLYQLEPSEYKLARALEVMNYQINTDYKGYVWWVDGLFMVMPVLSKLYRHTGDELYLKRMYEYWQYTDSVMYDSEECLYYRDRNYVYPKHQTDSGKKDFWARGDGWAIAALARVLHDIPEDHVHRKFYVSRLVNMAYALKRQQQADGYWTRSIMDPDYAPGCETSGAALMTYAIAWGMNNGLLPEDDFEQVVLKAWEYLSKTALQENGLVGYVQPIGSNASPGTTVSRNQTADFGVGAFLMAASEIYKMAEDDDGHPLSVLSVDVSANEILVEFSDTVEESSATALAGCVSSNDGEKRVVCSVEISGSCVRLIPAQVLDYGRYDILIDGIRSIHGGTMLNEYRQKVVLTVPLYPATNIKSVSAIGNQTGNTPENAVDNHLSSRWSQDGLRQWIQVELEAPVTLSAVDIAFYNGTVRNSYFDVQVSDDGWSFEDVLTGQQSSGQTNEMERYYMSGSPSARFVRIICNGNSQGGANWNSITELRAVGTQPADNIQARVQNVAGTDRMYNLSGIARVALRNDTGIYIHNNTKYLVK